MDAREVTSRTQARAHQIGGTERGESKRGKLELGNRVYTGLAKYLLGVMEEALRSDARTMR